MTTPQDIQAWIVESLPVSHIEVEGDGHHFSARIVSEAFQGKGTLERHRMVYAVLGDKMHAAIHALSLKTLTPTEDQQKR